MDFSIPKNPSKARKARDLSRESFSKKENRIRSLSLRKLFLGSDSTHSSAPPCGTKEPFVAPEGALSLITRPGIPLHYSATTAELDPEDIPSYYSIKVEREPTYYVEFCSKCGAEHHPLCSYCPPLPCKTCFDPHHTSAFCPYFSLIPKGANFDRVNYEIICGCGNIFNEDKWVCTLCNGRPKLRSKYCHICRDGYAQHSSHECPKDKERAARFKAIRDRVLSSKKIPYTG